MSAKDLLNLQDDESLLSDAYSSDEEQGKGKVVRKNLPAKDHDEDEDEDVDMSDDGADESKTAKPLSEKEAKAKLRAIKKSGVIYLSKIPPYMKPQKMKQILERFGEVGRIFLNPENENDHKRRVRSGGNRKTKYTEGWAEFKYKKDAKLCAETLNNNKIGGKKGSFYYDDILNVKYLRNFKWNNLTEGIAIEAQERRERLKAEIAQATKENKIFIENVERKAMFDNIKERKGTIKSTVHRTFDQKDTHDKKQKTNKSSSKDLDNVLAKVF